MLDVDGGVYVDAGPQQFLDILIAFYVARAGGVRVGQLVYENQLRMAGERAVEVEFIELQAPVPDTSHRQRLQPLKQRHRLGTRVRLDIADGHIYPLAFRAPRRLEHRVCLADAGGVAEEYFQRPLLFLPLIFQP